MASSSQRGLRPNRRHRSTAAWLLVSTAAVAAATVNAPECGLQLWFRRKGTKRHLKEGREEEPKPRDRLPPVEEPEERKKRLRRGKERILRDWHNHMPEAVVRQLDQAIGFFSSSVRIPAVALAGKALGVLFRLPPAPKASDEGLHSSALVIVRPWLAVNLWKFYVMLTGYAVCAQLTAVLLCSSAHAQILDIGRDELSLEPTALDLVTRHVEFEYVLVRTFFFSGLLALLLAIAAKAASVLGGAWISEVRLDRAEAELWLALCTLLGSTICWWIHVYFENMPYFGGGWRLLKRLFKLLKKDLRSGPLAALALLLMVAATGLTISSFFSRPGDDEENEATDARGRQQTV